MSLAALLKDGRWFNSSSGYNFYGDNFKKITALKNYFDFFLNKIYNYVKKIKIWGMICAQEEKSMYKKNVYINYINCVEGPQ